MERVHSYKYLGIWLTSTLCKSMKYAKKLGNKWVFFIGSFIPLQILQHSCNCTWPTTVHIWSTQHLYGLPTNKDLSTPLRECKNLHLRCAPNTGALIMSLCCNYANCPTLASRRHYLKLCVLYQVVNGHLDFPMAPVVPWNLPRSLRNTRTLALERPVTRTNAYQSSFFPHTITLWNSLPLSAQNCQTLHSFKQTVLRHTYTYT